MDSTLADNLALLARTPAAFDALLRDLPESWTTANEGADSWNAYDIVGHLAYTERADWMTRAKTILEHGQARGFDPLDRFAQKRESQGKSLSQLLDEFALLRRKNLDEVRAMDLSEDDLARRGRHPALGDVTLGQLLAAWATHDLTHLHQLSRILAYQNRHTVGPWSKFLGVLHCNGHSA